MPRPCVLQGELLHSWDGVRVNALACRGGAGGEGLVALAADTHHRVRHYDFGEPKADRNLCVPLPLPRRGLRL